MRRRATNRTQVTGLAFPESSSKVPTERCIVIFRQGSIGDFVVSLPCLHAIRAHYTNAKIVLLTDEPATPTTIPAARILEVTSLVDDYLTYKGGTRNIWELAKIRRALRKLTPDLLIYLAQPRGVLSAYRDTFFFRFCGIKRFVGLPSSHDMQNCRPPPPGGILWESQASRLARSLNFPRKIAVDECAGWNLRLSAAEIDDAERILREGMPSAQERRKVPLVGLSIGTKQQINDWGIRNWLAVLDGLKHLNFGLVLIGAPEDRERSQMLADAWRGPVMNLCGKISPRVSAAILQNVVVFLCHDSGPMHLAAAVGTRCVAVFSRLNPRGQWFPFGKNHTILYPPLATDTIQSIKPSQVIDACREILDAEKEPPDLQIDAIARRVAVLNLCKK